MSSLKCYAAKSAAQISTQLSGSQLSGDLSGIVVINKESHTMKTVCGGGKDSLIVYIINRAD